MKWTVELVYNTRGKIPALLISVSDTALKVILLMSYITRSRFTTLLDNPYLTEYSTSL